VWKVRPSEEGVGPDRKMCPVGKEDVALALHIFSVPKRPDRPAAFLAACRSGRPGLHLKSLRRKKPGGWSGRPQAGLEVQPFTGIVLPTGGDQDSPQSTGKFPGGQCSQVACRPGRPSLHLKSRASDDLHIFKEPHEVVNGRMVALDTVLGSCFRSLLSVSSKRCLSNKISCYPLFN